MDTGVRRHAPYFEQYTEFVFTHEQLQTLNSIPIALVTPSASQIVIPTFVVQMVKAGTAAFSSSLNLLLNLPADGSLLNGSSLSGVDGTSSVGPLVYELSNDFFDPTQDYAAYVGQAFYLTSDGDQTGGDGTVLTLRLWYQVHDTVGAI